MLRFWFMDKEVIIGEMEDNDITTYREYDVGYDAILSADIAAEDDYYFEEMIFSEDNYYESPFSRNEIRKMFVETPGCVPCVISIRRYLVNEATKRVKGDAA